MNHQNSDGSDSAPLGPRGGDVLYGEWGVTVIKKTTLLILLFAVLSAGFFIGHFYKPSSSSNGKQRR
jgi:hypothetical protein